MVAQFRRAFRDWRVLRLRFRADPLRRFRGDWALLADSGKASVKTAGARRLGCGGLARLHRLCRLFPDGDWSRPLLRAGDSTGLPRRCTGRSGDNRKPDTAGGAMAASCLAPGARRPRSSPGQQHGPDGARAAIGALALDRNSPCFHGCCIVGLVRHGKRGRARGKVGHAFTFVDGAHSGGVWCADGGVAADRPSYRVVRVSKLGLGWSVAAPVYSWGAALAVLASVGGVWAWNVAARNLPVALAAQLIVSETAFGVVGGLAVHGRWPTIPEAMGITVLIAGVVAAIHVFHVGRNSRHAGALA